MIRNTFTWSGWASFLLLSNIIGCVSILDRTTTVYGRVIDDAQQPIDSMEVSLSGVAHFAGGIVLATTYTDSEGNYKITYEIPKDYDRGNVYIHPSSIKSSDKYKERYLIYEDGRSTSSCCGIPIGTKKNYDFVLQSK